MARKKKPSGRLNKGPFGFADLDRAVRADGWIRIKGKTRHPSYEHPHKLGKVNISIGWSDVMYHHETFASVASQAGLTKKQLLKLLNQ
jgi:predicted RNA binding protein YcfA (HicA-like mRNA interferase family)